MIATYAQSAPRPPVIGISAQSTDTKSVAAMVAQVRAKGGIPMVLANHSARNAAEDIEKIDALFVMGADEDVDPNRYVGRYPANDPRSKIHPATQSAANTPEGAARLTYEEQMLNFAKQRKMPTLTVCRGTQLLNVMQGGGLIQHINDILGTDAHEQNKQGIPPFCAVTAAEIAKNSNLGAIAGTTSAIYTPVYPQQQDTIGVNENSFHHQAIDADCVGAGLRVTASSDSYVNPQGQLRRMVEAVEPDPQGPLAGWPMIGVQWHPEFGASEVSSNLIGAMVDHGAWYAKNNTRDSSRDQVSAMAANIVSAGKNSRLPATKSESYVQDIITARALAPTAAQRN